MMPSSTSTQPNQRRRKTALVLAGGGITGFLYEVGVLTALDELAGRALSNDFDVYVGTSAGAVLAALLANGAHAAEIFAAMTQNEAGSPFYFESRDILGVGSGGPLRMMGQFALATFGTLGRALRAKQRPSFAQMFADFQEHHPPGFYSTEALEKTLCDRFSVLGYSHQFDKLSRELFVTGTDIDTGEHLVFGAGEFADSHICRAVAASCAIPVFFRPIRIGDRDVVDGGVSEVCPLEIAVERGATAIVFVNPMVPIRNDRARICIPAPGGHCARLSEKGVGWGSRRCVLCGPTPWGRRSILCAPTRACNYCMSSPAATRCNFSCIASCRSRPAASCWNMEGIPVVASSQVPAQRFYRRVTLARAPRIIRSQRATLARPYKARHPFGSVPPAH